MYISHKCLTSRLLHNIRPANFSSQDTCHHWLAQGLHMIQLPQPCSYTHTIGINKCLETDMHSASSGTDPTAKKEPEKPYLGYSQFLCNIMWASPQLSFHSCNYGTFVGWCLHDLWVTCIHKYHRCYTSRLTTMLLQLSKHTDCMMLTRVIYCLSDAVLSAHILQSLRVKSIWQCMPHVYPWSFNHNRVLLCTVNTCNNALYYNK